MDTQPLAHHVPEPSPLSKSDVSIRIDSDPEPDCSGCMHLAADFAWICRVLLFLRRDWFGGLGACPSSLQVVMVMEMGTGIGLALENLAGSYRVGWGLGRGGGCYRWGCHVYYM